MSESVKVRLIVGVYREDLTDDTVPRPLIAGCMDQSTWEIIDLNESEEWARGLRRRYDPDETEFEWREVVASFDAEALRSIFQTLSVQGQVLPEDGS